MMEKDSRPVVAAGMGYPVQGGFFKRIVMWYVLLWAMMLLGQGRGLIWLYVGMLGPFAVWGVDMLLSACCQVRFETDGIRVVQFGRTVFYLPEEKIGMICGVGGHRSQNIFITELTLDQVAALREAELNKSPLRRGEVKYLKMSPAWRRTFTEEYLNRQRCLPFRFLADRRFLMIRCDAVMITVLRRLYPQVPYENLLKQATSVDKIVLKDFAPSQIAENFRAFPQEDGIHIFLGDKPRWVFPRECIRTIARVDRYDFASKAVNNHTPLLVVSADTVEELERVDLLPRDIENGTVRDYPWGAEMIAAYGCLAQAERWHGNKGKVCALFYSEEKEELLRELYPEAQWVSLV